MDGYPTTFLDRSTSIHLHLLLLCFHFASISLPDFHPSSPLNTMTSMFHKDKSLPVFVSHNSTQDPSPPPPGAGMRRRISSSMSFQIQPPTITAWALRSSKSVSSMGESASTSVRNWWDRGWAWILSRKPVFAQDLEMNQTETSVLGCHNKGSWRRILYKFRSEIRKLVGSDHPGLPQTIRSSKSYTSAI